MWTRSCLTGLVIARILDLTLRVRGKKTSGSELNCVCWPGLTWFLDTITFVNFYTERWKQMPISLKQTLCTQFKVGRPRLVSGTWSSTMFFHIIAVFGNWNGESAIKVIANFAVNSSYELWKTPVACMASS